MNGRPALREVARAKPRRGSGAPARSRSHYKAILELLCERRPHGVLRSEMYSVTIYTGDLRATASPSFVKTAISSRANPTVLPIGGIALYVTAQAMRPRATPRRHSPSRPTCAERAKNATER